MVSIIEIYYYKICFHFLRVLDASTYGPSRQIVLASRWQERFLKPTSDHI